MIILSQQHPLQAALCSLDLFMMKSYENLSVFLDQKTLNTTIGKSNLY